MSQSDPQVHRVDGSASPAAGDTPQAHGAEAGEPSTAWQVHGERLIYENRWVTVAMVDVETPDGERFDHHKVYLPSAAVLAMVDDLDRVYMMWRHRFVPDLWNWELPGGLVDAGEKPAQTVVREALEETGYALTGDPEHVVMYEPMIGTVTSPHHIYIARGVVKVAEPTEKNEAQRTAWIPLDEVPALIAAGQIANSGTLIAVQHLLITRLAK
ncbi:NUDIX hydrolase [Streptomyces erythrochromogenes]|uniref:NUDIX hydrolase n=1 Tax=Streptomyces erythrochromogenes TaxID=285574 RepID=UPI003431317C